MGIERIISEAKSIALRDGVNHKALDIATYDAYQDIADMAAWQASIAFQQAVEYAQSQLHTQIGLYVDNLTINSDFQLEIGDAAKHLEYGYSGFNMLFSLLQSPKAKTSKDGKKYMVIPLGATKGDNLKNIMAKKASDIMRLSSSSGASWAARSQIMNDVKSKAKDTMSTKGKQMDKFVTASSRQYGKKMWKHPGFSGLRQLDGINRSLHQIIVEEAAQLIKKQSMER